MIRNPKYKVNDEVEFELNGDSLKGKIVVVLSHTCPISYVPTDLFINGINQSGVDRSTEEWLGEIEYKLNYKN